MVPDIHIVCPIGCRIITRAQVSDYSDYLSEHCHWSFYYDCGLLVTYVSIRGSWSVQTSKLRTRGASYIHYIVKYPSNTSAGGLYLWSKGPFLALTESVVYPTHTYNRSARICSRATRGLLSENSLYTARFSLLAWLRYLRYRYIIVQWYHNK